MSTEYSLINCPDCEDTGTGSLIARRNNVGQGRTRMTHIVSPVVVQNRLTKAGISLNSQCIKGSDGGLYTYPEFHALMGECDEIFDEMTGIKIKS